MNGRIVIDPKVCHGQPVVRGARMPVSMIVGSLARGMSFEDGQREYALTLQDIRAALKFAGELFEQEQYHPLPSQAAPRRFVLDANMPRSAAGAVQRLGHDVVDVRNVGLGGTDDAQIAAYAKGHKLALVTRDFDISGVRNYPPAKYPGIIALELPDDAIAATVVKVTESFLSQLELLAQVPGRLAIVESWRLRFRPALS